MIVLGSATICCDPIKQMVNPFAEQAKTFWRLWGLVGEPMVMSIEAWAQMQRAFISWVRQTQGAGGSSER